MSDSCTNLVPLTEISSEKYLKRLAGRSDMEGALRRLDKLTQEEGQMAIAQILKVSHAVDDRTRIIADTVGNVGDQVKVVALDVRQTANDVDLIKRS